MPISAAHQARIEQRRQRVAELASQGLRDPDIARRLGSTPWTIAEDRKFLRIPGRIGNDFRPVPDRIAASIRRDEAGCDIWTAQLSWQGYAQIKIKAEDGRWVTRQASRVVYDLTYGVDPGELFVRHTCDTPACVRPEHLILGTQKDNMRDRAEHGAGYLRGEQHLNAVISDQDVQEMRTLHAQGWAQWPLARRFGISRSQARRIVAYESRTL